MNNKIRAVYESIFLRNKSFKYDKERLQISEEEYNRLKKLLHTSRRRLSNKHASEIINLAQNIISGKIEKIEKYSTITNVHENIEKGECKIVGESSYEPKSADEIIQILNIDTTKWKLSQYWNKQSAGGVWTISALVTKLNTDNVLESEFFEKLITSPIPKIPKVYNKIVNNNLEKVGTVMSLQDLHFGKVNNDDINKISTDAVNYLFSKAVNNYCLDETILVIGSDTLNMDTFLGTTTKGTFVENSENATNTYIKAFNAISKIIGIISQYSNHLTVMFIPGNHDRLSSFHLLHALSQSFIDWDNITFDIEYKERKVTTYGSNMLAFEHGDISAKNNPLVYAVEFPKEWGDSKYRILYTGHYHSRKTKEVITENEEHGFITRIIPALTSTDYYHYHNKYIGSARSALLHIHDPQKGLIAEYTYTV